MTQIPPGTLLGRYEVVAPLGAGGMGLVYTARDRSLDRVVAIKILPSRVANDGSARLRFEREARLLAALSHPNILAIHDFGNEGGVLFAVTELLEGCTLRDRLGSGPLPLDAALEYADGIAAGLGAAHAKGIVHRDLKPENVFLPRDGGVKVLDFGIARLVRLDDPEAATVAAFSTEPGVAFGTAGYMSPEQLCGLEAGAAADVFSFGVMLQEMLTGRPPFGRGPRAEYADAVLNRSPEPVPPDLGPIHGIVATCLHKDATRRYQSAEELRAALGAVQSAASGRAASPPSSPWDPSPARRATSIAVLPFADMSPRKELDYLCEGIAEEILSSLAKVTGLRVVARSSAFQFKAAADVRVVGRTLQVDSVLEGSVRVAGDRLRVVTQLIDAESGYQLWSERFDRRLDDVFAVQDEIAAAVAATLDVRLGTASAGGAAAVAHCDAETYALFLKGRHHWNRRTESDLHRSLEYLTAAVARVPGYADAHGALAEAYATLGLYGALRPDEAMPKARTAAEAALRIRPTLPGAIATLGCVHALFDWSWAAAEREFRRAIDLVPGASAAPAWYALNHLVPCARFQEAERQLRRALDVDPLSLAIATGAGICAYYAREYHAAISGLSSALDLDAGFAMARHFRGLALAELGRHDEALADLDAATRAAPGSLEMHAAAGYVLARAGNAAAARQRLGELLTHAGTRYVSPGLLAQIHAGLGDLDETCAWLARAVDIRAADVAWMGVRPAFDGARADPRFQTLAGQIGIPGTR